MAKRRPTAATRGGVDLDDLEEPRVVDLGDLAGSKGKARRFYLLLLVVVLLVYPFVDPLMFGPGSEGRIAGYSDAGFYVILALGLNIVVGFAGLLDLGYVAFFAIGAYAWGMIASPQLGFISGLQIPAQLWPWLCWPLLIAVGLLAALWGAALGLPTLRLRGDYLAIVTLGFGEIIPIAFLELDRFTNGTNGIVGVYTPVLPGVDWNSLSPVPFYYLVLVLIALTILANLRLRDSRLGRAWIAVREDELAAMMAGINPTTTKLLAFAAGAFLAGVAGAYHATKIGLVSPDDFSFGNSVIYLAMVVVGGIGSIPGVIVGALAVYFLNQFVLAQLDPFCSDPTSILHAPYVWLTQVYPGFTFGNIRNLIFGVLLVVIMIYRPAGLIPSVRRKRELTLQNNEPVEVSSLDSTPGTREFENEIVVK